ncbi:hypothetical protein SAMN05443663_10647 [Flavobacterium defluvii]|uniref:Uncharacterized protein n=1 Tax=Flavobacterium defluvii TaxID=370979 RepID=A0A1M5QX65_9FLAO|nr:hypothetical protein SAMN05443663_10647 [Flavobacterium defluvii]
MVICFRINNDNDNDNDNDNNNNNGNNNININISNNGKSINLMRKQMIEKKLVSLEA